VNDGGGGIPKATVDQSDTRLDTASRLAKEYGVSVPTIKRDGQYAEAVDKLGRRNLTPDQMSLLRGSRYNRMKQDHGGDRRSKVSKGQIVTFIGAILRQIK
jgi:hypothetical protein